jgi:predicted phosphodiesterase
MKMTAETMVINPGESTDWLTGQSHIVVLDIDGMRAQEIEL